MKQKSLAFNNFMINNMVNYCTVKKSDNAYKTDLLTY